MKISPSKRSRPRGEARPLHTRLAQRRAWQQRLMVGSVLAFGGAALGWLVGLPLVWQGVLTAIGLGSGLFWRFGRTSRLSESWAFSWIEARAGLSYQTAVELAGGDAHGLGEAVRARAARASGLPLPALQPWYLPLLLFTGLLLVLPYLILPELRTPLAGVTGPLRSETSPLEPPEEAEAAPQATPEEQALRQNAPLMESQGVRERNGETPTDADSRGSFDSEAIGERGAAAVEGEQAALEAFLARQQPDPNAQPGEGEGGSSPAGSTERQAANSREGAGNDERTGGEGAGQEQGEQNAASESGEQGSEAQSPGEQHQGQAEDEEVQQASGDSAQPQEVPPDEQMRNTGRTAQESERNNEQTSTEGVDMLQMRNSGSQEQENLNQMIREGEASERAGTGPGADIESSRERLGSNTNRAERLLGERGEGPSSLVRSQVLGEGSTPPAMPESGTAESYRRAAEEVIREGRIPAEYQNIVRDYFR